MGSAKIEGLDLARETTNLKTILLGGAATIAGIIVNLAAGNYLDSAWVPTAQGIGSALVSIGLISLGLELILRRQLQREVLKLVGIERSISANQVASVGQMSEVD